MKTKYVTVVAIVTGLIGWAAGTSFSEDTPPSPEQILEMMKQMGQPGEMHKALDGMTGSWNVGVKTWNGGEEAASTATAAAEWMLGGRFLKHNYNGDMFGAPFTGFGLMGYNNNKKHYESVWIDSFSSNISVATGEASDGGKVITFKGVWEGPNDMKSPYRMVYAMGTNGYTLTSYAEHEGTEVKEMELTYVRGAAPATASPAAAPAPAPIYVQPATTYYDPCRPCPPPPRCRPRRSCQNWWR